VKKSEEKDSNYDSTVNIKEMEQKLENLIKDNESLKKTVRTIYRKYEVLYN
jgi:hypothetical protein